MESRSEACILIVEDDSSLRDFLAADFARKGYQVRTAEGGWKAYEQVEQGGIDLILTDINMPLGNGMELLGRVKEGQPCLPVLFLWGGLEPTPEQAYEAGAEALLPKPFLRRQLFEAVERALQPREWCWAPRPERVEVDREIHLILTDSDDALQGRMLSLGRGGMFVALDESRLPETGDTLAFCFDFAMGSGFQLRGDGVVRWVRDRSQPGRPAGFGMEFTLLEEGVREKILELIQAVKMKAYIPSR